jgi:hypothetical protein
MVIHLPINLRREVIEPRLGSTCAVVLSLYLCCGFFWSRLYENERSVLLPTAIALAFWISIRALIRAVRPPSRGFGGIFFTLHLLNLCMVITLSVLGLLGLLKGSWWEWWEGIRL